MLLNKYKVKILIFVHSVLVFRFVEQSTSIYEVLIPIFIKLLFALQWRMYLSAQNLVSGGRVYLFGKLVEIIWSLKYRKKYGDSYFNICYDYNKNIILRIGL